MKTFMKHIFQDDKIKLWLIFKLIVQLKQGPKIVIK